MELMVAVVLTLLRPSVDVEVRDLVELRESESFEPEASGTEEPLPLRFDAYGR